MQSVTPSSGKSTANKRIRKPVPDDVSMQVTLRRTDFLDYKRLLLSDFDEDDWLNPKGYL